MKYSLDFKPRFIVMGAKQEDGKSTRVDFCFYDYNKHKDIKCYYIENEEAVPVDNEIVTDALSRFYCNDDTKLQYRIKFESDPALGDIWICRAVDPNGIAFFVGYSEYSAYHAVEDLENAKRLILQRYYPKNSEE